MRASEFLDLFFGRRDVHGRLTDKPFQSKTPLNEQCIKDHLNGDYSVGVYPIVDGSLVKFFVLDFDEHDETLRERIFPFIVELKNSIANNYDLPGYLERSKGKGYHLWYFFEDLIDAKKIRMIFKHFLKDYQWRDVDPKQGDFHYPEFFPKQDSVEEDEYGNFIFLPLQGKFVKLGKTKFVDDAGVPFPKQFQYMDSIEHIRVELIDDLIRTNEITEDSLLETPSGDPKEGEVQKKYIKDVNIVPCIHNILSGGVGKGRRNDIAFKVSTFLRGMGFEKYMVRPILEDWNKGNTPPLDTKELDTIMKSSFDNKKKYKFNCEQMEEFCDKTDCPYAKNQVKIIWKNIREVHPVLDYIGDSYYIGVPLWAKDAEDRTVKRSFIVHNHKLMPFKAAEFRKMDIVSRSSISFPVTSRWAPEDIARFLRKPEGKSPFKQVRRLFKYYIDCSDRGFYNFMGYWTLGTYIFPIFPAYPYIFINGKRGSGKTRVLEVTQHLAFNSKTSASMSAATLFRLCHGQRPTLLFDEVEQMANRKLSEELDIMPILLAGYRNSDEVYRCESAGSGQSQRFEIKAFEVYGPKMLANIKGISNPALQDRCIQFIMSETTNNEYKSRFIDPENKDWQQGRNALYRYAACTHKEIKDIFLKLELPFENISGREWELWRPILAIALQHGQENYDKMVELFKYKHKESLFDLASDIDSVIIKIAYERLMEKGLEREVIAQDEIRRMVVDYTEESEDFGENFKLSSQFFGKIMKRLSFEKQVDRTNRRSYVLEHAKLAPLYDRMFGSGQVTSLDDDDVEEDEQDLTSSEGEDIDLDAKLDDEDPFKDDFKD